MHTSKKWLAFVVYLLEDPCDSLATETIVVKLIGFVEWQAYFGCFFPLPVVISSMRWGPAAGRKTMVW